jgi:predicted AlkP superfamily phosphohydrolase/phosphomutase
VYSGPYVDRGPDIVLNQTAGVHIEGKIGHDDAFGSPSRWHGENKDTGMFIAHGTEIDGNGSITDMHILDIAPTLLHLHGEGVPEQMDGEIKGDLFTAESEPANRVVVHIDAAEIDSAESQAVESDVADRLEDLGYME